MQSRLGVTVAVLICVCAYATCTAQRTLAIARTTPGGWIATQLNRCGDRGYELVEFRFVDGVDLRLWSGCGMAITASLPESALIELREHRWVGDHRAVYFDMRLREQQDSIFIEDNAKILFDFETAQLYIASPLRLWRGWSLQKNWLTDADLEKLLKSIERAANEGY